MKIRHISSIHQYLTVEAAKTVLLFTPSWTIVILFYQAAPFIFSVDYGKFRKVHNRSQTGFQSTEMWPCTASCASSSLVTGASQNRLQTVSYLSQHLWLTLVWVSFSLCAHPCLSLCSPLSESLCAHPCLSLCAHPCLSLFVLTLVWVSVLTLVSEMLRYSKDHFCYCELMAR